MMASYQTFRQTERGRAVYALVSRSIVAMEDLSRRGEPAVAAIDRAIAEEIGPLDDTERQHTGRVVRDLLVPLGWRPRPQRRRVRNGQAFVSGTVYEQPAEPTPPVASFPRGSSPDRLARADEAVAILACARYDNAGTVDDFVAERRAEARRDEQ